MPHSADAIANFFLDRFESNGDRITHMKLQKLVYYAHGWHLALADCALIREGVQAWEYGPVVQTLYHEFKEFGNGPITRKATEVRFENLGDMEVFEPSIDTEDSGLRHELVKAVLDRVWEVYARFTPIQLSDMTHAEGTPWWTVTTGAQKKLGYLPKGMTIPDPLIQKWFKSQLQPPT
jgi:uncharacterized phage-associated protein